MSMAWMSAFRNMINAVKAAVTPPTTPLVVKHTEWIALERFVYLTQLVISYLESGYYHPHMKEHMSPADQKVLANSGETMYGLDRLQGASLSVYPEWKEFWAVIDAANAATRWGHYYMGGPDAPKLKELASKIMYRWFTQLFERHVSYEAKAFVIADERLIIHLSYACWNGEKWFKIFSYALNDAVKKGIVTKQRLYEETIKARTESGNSTIRKQGVNMLKMFAALHL
jgi:hypothetical protein